MGQILSSSTVYSVAYLTEIGRSYLFGKDSNGNPNRFVNGVDLFEIAYFGLFDDDTNYTTSQLLQSGDVPDLTGSINPCLKATKADSPQWSVAWNGTIPPPGVTYIVTPPNISITV